MDIPDNIEFGAIAKTLKPKEIIQHLDVIGGVMDSMTNAIAIIKAPGWKANFKLIKSFRKEMKKHHKTLKKKRSTADEIKDAKMFLDKCRLLVQRIGV